MRTLVASALVVSVSLMGCFPHSARNRAIAEITEGALVAGGVVLEAGVTTQADCQAQTGMGCSSSSGAAGGIGLGMILLGLVGFIATISSSDDKPTPPAIDIKATPTALEPVAAPAPIAPAPTTPAPAGSGA
jgi:hypothetical protein